MTSFGMSSPIGLPSPSSPPPSTPRPSRLRSQDASRAAKAAADPSTTPAGAPPSSARTFTPVGLPPSSSFGSSGLGYGSPVPTKLLANSFLTSHRQSLSPANGQELAPAGTAPSGGVVASGMSITGAEHDISTMRPPKRRQRDQRKLEDDIAEIDVAAKDLTSRLSPPPAEEPDVLILETESLVSCLYPSIDTREKGTPGIESALEIVPTRLRTVWQTVSDSMNGSENEKDNSCLQNATAVSSLWLSLLHPPPLSDHIPSRALALRGPSRMRSHSTLPAPTPHPKAILDWLAQYRSPFDGLEDQLRLHQPNPTAHPNYWDGIFLLTLHGQMRAVHRLMKMSNFSCAASASSDQHAQKSYSSLELGRINEVIGQATRLLDRCPALRDEWHVAGPAWQIFRGEVEQASKELTTFAEGSDETLYDPSASLEASRFGLDSRGPSALRQNARKANSRVPWTIYKSLKILYDILLGGESILNLAADWLEASLLMTVWWDGNEDDNPLDSRRSLRHSTDSAFRLVDTNPVAAYRHRLVVSYGQVRADGNLNVDTNDAVDVALAAVCLGLVDDVLLLVHQWSLTITAALVEIGHLAGWYHSEPAAPGLEDLDESDLMVLSYAQPKKALTLDGVLIEYAEALGKRSSLQFGSSQDHLEKEGWEMAVQILNRLDDGDLALRKMGELLAGFPVETDTRMDKIIRLCHDLQLDAEYRKVAERFADHIAESSARFGQALVYYAYAHQAARVRTVLELLIAYCLVHSTAYPTSADLDPQLRDLLQQPRRSLSAIAQIDGVAAELLSQQMSGYAALRQFYEQRDAAPLPLSVPEKHRRQIALAPVLLAVIASAADNIQGGLFDQGCPAVVPVQPLLALLGEASALLDGDARVMSLPQLLVLLRAIEDLEVVHPRIRQQCQECLDSCLAAVRSQSSLDPQALLRKSIREPAFRQSGVGLFESAFTKGPPTVRRGMAAASHSSAQPKEGQARGWDWRLAKSGHMSERTLIRQLRERVAQLVAQAWIDGETA